MSFQFSLTIIELYRKMVAEKEYTLSKQLLKSATSIGANIQEALAAQTKKDFISKMCIASKEARETRYWLSLFQESALCDLDYTGYLKDVDSIIKVLTKIVKTSQVNISKAPLV